MGQAVLQAGGTARVAIEQRHERRRVARRPEGILEEEPLSFPHLGLLGDEPPLAEGVAPEDARPLGILGLSSVELAGQGAPGGGPQRPCVTGAIMMRGFAGMTVAAGLIADVEGILGVDTGFRDHLPPGP